MLCLSLFMRGHNHYHYKLYAAHFANCSARKDSAKVPVWRSNKYPGMMAAVVVWCAYDLPVS